MNKQIDFYLDFTSPYAYLGATQIEALAARHQCKVIWRPFLIGASFKVTGRKAPIQHPLVREYTLNDVQRYARLLDQPLNFPGKFPILAVKSSRLFYYLQNRDQNQQEAKVFARDVFQAYFVDRMDITRNDVLARLAEPYGLSESDVDQVVNSNEMKVFFKQVVDHALDRGVFGAPMFIVEDEMFWGVDRLGQLDQWLEKGGW